MLDGLVGQLVGDKQKTLQNHGLAVYVGRACRLVGRQQATSSKKTQCFQCLSACRSCRYYVGAVGPTSPTPNVDGRVKPIPHERLFRERP